MFLWRYVDDEEIWAVGRKWFYEFMGQFNKKYRLHLWKSINTEDLWTVPINSENLLVSTPPLIFFINQEIIH